MTPPEPTTISPETVPWEELVQRATQGDAAAWQELEKKLREQPRWWESFGDLGWQTLTGWLDLVAGQNLVQRHCLEAEWQALKTELGQTTTSPIERLLVERVATCWLHLHHAEAVCASFRGQEVALAVVKEAERRMDRAHRRYLAALRQLATLRRLLPTPPVAKTRPAARGKVRARHKARRRASPTARPAAPPLPAVLADRLRGLAETFN